MRRRSAVFFCSLLAVTGCVQVGSAISTSAASSWSVVPLRVSAYSSSLGGISCGGSSFCIATGWTLGQGPKALDHPLIERWNGSMWTPMQSPAVSGVNVQLGAVSCTSPTFCMLVGNTWASGSISSLTERWNGKRWKIVTNAAEGLFPMSISCIGSSFCVFVGTNEIGSGHTDNFGEVWNGTSWTSTPTPNQGYSGLNGVHCVTPTSCVAVGFSDEYGSPVQSLSFALAWDGSTWSRFPSENGPDPAGDNALGGVTCRKTLSSCVAVGSYTPSVSGAAAQSLIESWTPTSWVIVTSPQASGGSNYLGNASCPRVTDCVAVGDVNEGELIEVWNGSTWTVTPGADVPGSAQDFLGGIACTHKVCFAVGTWAVTAGQPQHALLITSTIG